MIYRNSHITFVYLLRDNRSGVVFSIACDTRPTDYTNTDVELLATQVINWGVNPDDKEDD